jgi:adenylate cyclase
MRPESIFLIITVLGAVVAVLAHGLQLVDRYQNWRASRHEPSRPEPAAEKPRPSPLTIGALVLFLAVAGGSMTLVALHDFPAPPRASLAPPEGQSVAVMPFRPVGDTPDGNVIAEGLTQNVTTALSAVPGLFVIAGQSVAIYRGQDADLVRVGREQGVRDILTGAVQHGSANKLRVTVTLSEASTGRQLWSDRFDRTIEDMFDVQDDIALNVATSLQIRLTEGEQARFRRKGTRNFESWRMATQAFAAFQRYDPASNAEARRLAEEAVRLDPGYP